MTSYVTNAPRGMELMNLFSGREWVLEFDLDAFDISLESMCILGQQYGSYDEGLKEIFGEDHSFFELEFFAVSYGFATSMDIERNRLLQQEWEQLITEQRAELGVS